MAEEQVARSLNIKGLRCSRRLIDCSASLSKLYTKNLADLRNLDQSCESESGQKLAQLIWFHKREALEPMEKVCCNEERVAELRHNIETVGSSMKQICEAYRARTGQDFKTDPQYVSSLSSMELLLRVLIETQAIKEIANLKACISSTMEKGWLSSFCGIAKDDSGGPTVLFVCENQGKNGTSLITGGSKSKLEGYAPLQLAVNQNRASSFFPEEREDIRQKTASNRRATEKMMNDPSFVEEMNTKFEVVRKWEIVKGYWNEEKRKIEKEVAKEIRRIGKVRKGSKDKAKRCKIQGVKLDRKDEQEFIIARIREAQKMANKALLEITAEARQRAWYSALPADYWDHTDEPGLAMLSDGLQPISPCWMCHGIFRFDQWIEDSGIRWNGNDHEKGEDAGVCAEAIAHAQSKRKRS